MISISLFYLLYLQKSELSECENRECVLLSRLNNDPHLDMIICEAMKLHMMVVAMDLYIDNISGANIPLFAMIMYARHTSQTPEELMTNHLNPVGDTAGLEQVEFYI